MKSRTGKRGTEARRHKESILVSLCDECYDKIAHYNSKGELEEEEELEEREEDTTPPEINVTGVANGQQYSKPVIPVMSVSDDTDPSPSMSATLDGDPFTSGTEVSEIGEHELVGLAIDASGNEAEVVVDFEIMPG